MTVCWNVARWGAREKRNKEKDDEFWLLWGVFNKYIKENIFKVVKKRKVLRKENFDSVDICRLMKNQSPKTKSSRKTDSNFTCF